MSRQCRLAMDIMGIDITITTCVITTSSILVYQSSNDSGILYTVKDTHKFPTFTLTYNQDFILNVAKLQYNYVSIRTHLVVEDAIVFLTCYHIISCKYPHEINNSRHTRE
jgi:hypothetical protein